MSRLEKIEAWAQEVSATATLASAIGSIIAAAGVGFAAVQLHDARRAQDAQVYANISASWHEHLTTFLDHDNLRPYFFDGKPLGLADPLAGKVEAMADLRLDAMDRVVVAAQMGEWREEDFSSWRETFERAFATSPALCATYKSVPDDYDDLADIADKGCSQGGRTHR